MSDDERARRWHLAVGAADEGGCLGARDRRLAGALDALYGDGGAPPGGRRRGGLGGSAPRVAAWLGDIREFFPAPVVQLVQRDAFERLDLKAMLLEPEFMGALEADVHLVADLVALRGAMPDKAKDTAREIVAKVVADLMERLERKTAEALRGAVVRGQRTRRPRFADIDWPRTIRANLHHYDAARRTVIPERLVGFARHRRRKVDLDEIVMCVDQSGSMATSVVYASIFSAVMASLPVVRTKLVCFDTSVLDLTDDLADPVEVLFGVQLGGGTDIDAAVGYCAERIERPAKAHLVLITDLYEGGDAASLLRRLGAAVRAGVNVIVLLALSDDGRPAYDARMAGRVAAMGIPVFACTPDLFPDLMAAALRRGDLAAWAAARDVALVRGAEGDTPPQPSASGS